MKAGKSAQELDSKQIEEVINCDGSAGICS